MDYFRKMKGTTKSPPAVKLTEILWSWAGGFLGVAVVALIHYSLFTDEGDYLMIIGSFGASAVLIFGAIKSPLAQPRNLVGGHVISALIGVFFFKVFHDQMWLAASLAVATAIAAMHVTKTLHPPGGATALIAVTGGAKVHSLGYLYALMPVGLGVLIMLAVALLFNNIPKGRRYPEFWF
jgi:CBS-domain-containing membrane protein